MFLCNVIRNLLSSLFTRIFSTLVIFYTSRFSSICCCGSWEMKPNLEPLKLESTKTHIRQCLSYGCLESLPGMSRAVMLQFVHLLHYEHSLPLLSHEPRLPKMHRLTWVPSCLRNDQSGDSEEGKSVIPSNVHVTVNSYLFQDLWFFAWLLRSIRLCIVLLIRWIQTCIEHTPRERRRAASYHSEGQHSHPQNYLMLLTSHLARSLLTSGVLKL